MEENTNTKSQTSVEDSMFSKPIAVESDNHCAFDKLHEYAIHFVLLYLSIEDLTNCRLVNHLWDQVSLRVIFKKLKCIGFSKWRATTKACVETRVVSDIQRFTEIIGKTRNLKIIIIQGNDIFNHITEVLSTSVGTRLSSLILDTAIYYQHMIMLSEMRLQLKSLYMRYARKNIESKTIVSAAIKTFLESQCASLREFGLRYHGPGEILKLHFPRMQKLKLLRLSSEDPILYPNISYVVQFPVLKTLFLSGDNPECFACFFKYDMDPIETVDELLIRETRISASRIRCVPGLFPKLRKMQIQAEAEVLKYVIWYVPNLEELWVKCWNHQDVDAFMFGVSRGVLTKIKFTAPYKQMEKARRQGLQKFKRLRKLTLEAKGSSRIRITDFGCSSVLLNMQRLEAVKFLAEYPQISSSVMGAMQKQFVVKVSNGNK